VKADRGLIVSLADMAPPDLAERLLFDSLGEEPSEPRAACNPPDLAPSWSFGTAGRRGVGAAERGVEGEGRKTGHMCLGPSS